MHELLLVKINTAIELNQVTSVLHSQGIAVYNTGTVGNYLICDYLGAYFEYTPVVALTSGMLLIKPNELSKYLRGVL